jgi:hypothetical protein
MEIQSLLHAKIISEIVKSVSPKDSLTCVVLQLMSAHTKIFYTLNDLLFYGKLPVI